MFKQLKGESLTFAAFTFIHMCQYETVKIKIIVCFTCSIYIRFVKWVFNILYSILLIFIKLA